MGGDACKHFSSADSQYGARKPHFLGQALRIVSTPANGVRCLPFGAPCTPGTSPLQPVPQCFVFRSSLCPQDLRQSLAHKWGPENTSMGSPTDCEPSELRGYLSPHSEPHAGGSHRQQVVSALGGIFHSAGQRRAADKNRGPSPSSAHGARLPTVAISTSNI